MLCSATLNRAIWKDFNNSKNDDSGSNSDHDDDDDLMPFYGIVSLLLYVRKHLSIEIVWRANV